MTSNSQSQKAPKLHMPIGERDHAKGSMEAPIQIVEWGDFECPHCGHANIVIQDLLRRMGDQVNYVYRHFPLSKIHPQATLAAEASEAADAQGKFWEMHDLLFKYQADLSNMVIFELAEQLDLDMKKFRSDIDNHVYTDRVNEDFKSGVRSGVNGTPTLFVNGNRYDGAWDLESLMEIIEKPLGVRIRLVTQEFAQLAAAGGIMISLFTIFAILWVNFLGNFLGDYFHFFETNLEFHFGDFSVEEHLLEWINDGLMAIFFFVVGLEIKREVTVGELASRKKAALPVAGAIGGMIFPAAIYAIVNYESVLAGKEEALGWSIPMATDIAFTIVLLTVLGNRVPFSLKVFFSALAIADDLGAVIVIAIFYSTEILVGNIILTGIFFLLLLGFNRARVYWTLPYILLGLGMWLALLESGIHPTLAGVLLAITIPTRSPANTKSLLTQCVTLLDEFELSPEDAENRRQSMINTLETITDRMQSPAQRLERDLNPWTTFLVLPIFALANTGIDLELSSLSSIFHPVALGIILGLVIGKPLGITLLAWLAIKFGIAEMPEDISWSQFISAGVLAGIGFTMSIFLTNTALTDPDLIGIAKIGILTASIIAAVLGVFLLNKNRSHYDGITNIELVLEQPS